MVIRRLRTPAHDFGAVRQEFEVPETFSDAALAELSQTVPESGRHGRDETALPLVTLDPPDSRDLDQAMHLARRGNGYRISYAIADVPAFVRPGGALDAATWERGVTVYCPDRRTPLHPEALSEGAASLLPGQVCPAVLWRIDLDADGAVVDVDLGRALVRSVAKLGYPAVQSTVDRDAAHESIALLPEIGRLRQDQARRRHAVELNLPDQEVVSDGADGWTLVFRAALPVELWNAQISLVTGIGAAQLMLDAGVGILRTLPPARDEDVRRLRRLARSLDIEWPAEMPPGDLVARLQPDLPRHAAFTEEAATLLRGAGYAAFDGAAPEQPLHAGVAAPYAHVTAPLRRLVDRYGTEVCLAHAAGSPVPAWVRDRLEDLPEAMAGTTRRAGAVERAVLDLTEAHLLAGRVGQNFDAVVADTGPEHGTVVLADLAVRARCEAPDLPLGERLIVRLIESDPAERRVRFVPA